MTVTEKLAALRQNMEARGLEGCIVVTDDFHGSEYVGAHFKAREFLSGFTGSAGTLAVLREGAYLWTDGRYFLQAERQLEGSGIQLMRAGQPGVPTLSQFLAEQLPEGGPSAHGCTGRWKRRWRTSTSGWTAASTRRRAFGRTGPTCPPRRYGPSTVG